MLILFDPEILVLNVNCYKINYMKNKELNPLLLINITKWKF